MCKHQASRALRDDWSYAALDGPKSVKPKHKRAQAGGSLAPGLVLTLPGEETQEKILAYGLNPLLDKTMEIKASVQAHWKKDPKAHVLRTTGKAYRKIRRAMLHRNIHHSTRALFLLEHSRIEQNCKILCHHKIRPVWPSIRSLHLLLLRQNLTTTVVKEVKARN